VDALHISDRRHFNFFAWEIYLVFICGVTVAMNRPVSGGRGWEIRIGFIGRAPGSNALRTNFYLSACWLEGRIIPAAANASQNQTNVMCIYADSVIFIGFFIENCHMWTACGQRVVFV
jgi:hypothetical protein